MLSITIWIDFFRYMLHAPTRRFIKPMNGLRLRHAIMGFLILLGVPLVGWGQVLQSEWSLGFKSGTNAQSSVFETRLNVANFMRVYTRPNMHMGTKFGNTNQIQGKVIMGPEPLIEKPHEVAHGVLNLTVPMALQVSNDDYTHLVGSMRWLGYTPNQNTLFIRPKEMIQQRVATTNTKGVYANVFVLDDDFLPNAADQYELVICLDKESLDHPTPFVMTIIQENTSTRNLTRRIAFAKGCVTNSDSADSNADITRLDHYHVLWPGQHMGDGPIMNGHVLYTLFFMPSGKLDPDPKYYILGDVIKGFN